MKRFSITMSAVALGVLAAPASAATYIITYEGVVTNSTDTTGVFGDAGANLNGLSFTAVYTLTAPLQGAQAYYNSAHNEYSILGDRRNHQAIPVSGTLTINGITETVNGDYYGEARHRDAWNAEGTNYDPFIP